MVKIIIDEIKRDRRSLREVLPASSRNSGAPHTKRTTTKTIKYNHDDEPSTGVNWLWGTLIIIALVVIVGYFVAPIFTKVTVEVTQKTDSADVNESLQASRETTSDLSFSVLPSIQKTLTTEVPASGSKQAEVKASGIIKISNNTTSAQPLVATTRFITSAGKIYRLNKDTVVPAAKGAVPGAIEVTVSADKPGSDYNIGITDFTLPGLAGTDKASKITARSVSPISGGLIGTIRIVASSSEASIKADLAQKIKNELSAEVVRQLPDGFFTSKNLMTIDYDVTQLPQTDQSKPTATFQVSGSVSAVIFDEAKFTSYLMKKVLLKDNLVESIKITNMPELAFTPTEAGTDWAKAKDFNFTVTGKANLLWQVDSAKLAKELAGKPKNSYAEVFDGYGESITSGEVRFKPAWSRYFPTNPSNIAIELLTAK